MSWSQPIKCADPRIRALDDLTLLYVQVWFVERLPHELLTSESVPQRCRLLPAWHRSIRRKAVVNVFFGALRRE